MSIYAWLKYKTSIFIFNYFNSSVTQNNEVATVGVNHLIETVQRICVSMESSSSHFLLEMTQTSFRALKVWAEINRKGISK